MIRKLTDSDRSALENILRQTDEFHEEEIDVALELIDEALNNDEQDYYIIFVMEEKKIIFNRSSCIQMQIFYPNLYPMRNTFSWFKHV